MRVTLLQFLYPVLALVAFVEPFWGVVYYTFISVVRPEQLTYGNSQISGVFATAIVCLLLASLFRGERLFKALQQRYLVHFGLFVVGLYLSTFASPYTDYNEKAGSLFYLNQLPQIFVFCTCLFAVLMRSDQERFGLYLRLLVGFFLFMGLWGIDQYFRGNTVVERLFGSAVTDRCAITGVYVLYFPLAVYLFKHKEKGVRLLGLVGIAVFLTMIVLTQSRAGFLGFCVVMTAMFVYSKRKKVFIGCSLLMLLVGLFFVPESYYDRIGQIQMQDTKGGELTDYSSASRLLLWQLGVKMATDHPLLGVGNLNFPKASGAYLSDFRDTTDRELFFYTFGGGERSLLSHTHNTFLNIFVEGGVLSAVPYYLMLFVPLWRGHRLNRSFREGGDDRLDALNCINCGIAGYLVTAFFANMIFIDYLYWNLTISAFLIYQLEMKRAENEAPVCLDEAKSGTLVSAQISS